MMGSEDPDVVAAEPAAEDLVVGEPRWHMASAVIAAVVLTLLMPDDLRLGPSWLLPASWACCSSLRSSAIRGGSTGARPNSGRSPSG